MYFLVFISVDGTCFCMGVYFLASVSVDCFGKLKKSFLLYKMLESFLCFAQVHDGGGILCMSYLFE